MKLKIGDRVQVSQSYHWAKGQTGSVVSTRQGSFGGGLLQAIRRRLRIMRGVEPVWVRFDQPQIDPDGDGPYEIATLTPDALQRLD